MSVARAGVGDIVVYEVGQLFSGLVLYTSRTGVTILDKVSVTETWCLKSRYKGKTIS